MKIQRFKTGRAKCEGYRFAYRTVEGGLCVGRHWYVHAPRVFGDHREEYRRQIQAWCDDHPDKAALYFHE